MPKPEPPISVLREAILPRGGDMGARIRAHDWTNSPLGPPETWSRALRMIVDLMINSRHPMFVAWGPDLAFLYNDGYAPILGAKHPWALGRPFQQVWPEIWSDILPLIERALSGEATWSENLHLVMERKGFPEDTWYSFSYSPARDDDGNIAGMFCACTETTGHVLAEAALRAASDRSVEILESVSDAFYAVDRDWRFTYINRKAEQLWGRTRDELIGKIYWTEFPNVVGSEAYDAHLRVARTRQPEHFETISPILHHWIEVNIYPAAEGGMSVYFRDITQRKKNEAALIESEARWRGLFEQMQEGFFVCDTIRDHSGRVADFRFVEVNPAFETLTGIPAEAALGRLMREAIPGIQEELIQTYIRVMEHDEPMQFEVHVPALADRWYEARARRTSGDRLAVMFLDITARKKAEAALRESEARFRNMADTAPVMIWTTDPKGYCTYLNSSWYRFTGQTKEEAEGFGWLKATHPEDRERAGQTFLDAIKTRGSFRIEYRLRRADGSYAYTIDAANPRFGGNGEFLGHVGSVLDITDRRASEEALQKMNETLEAQVAERTQDLRLSEARVRSILETSYQYQGLLSPDGTLLDTNRASLESIHAQRRDVLGRRYWDTPWFADTAGMTEVVKTACVLAAAGSSVHQEIQLNLPIGQRSFDFSMRPVRNDQGEVVAIVAEAADITDRRKTEEALRQSQKVEAMGQLTGGIAHDFNNLLTAVLGNLEIIQRRVTDERIKRLAQNAIQAAERGAKLTGQLLAFSRSQKLALRAIDVNALLNGMDDLLDRSAGPTVAVGLELADELKLALGDANQLEAAVLNLVINARDAMPDGGNLDISTREVFIAGDPELRPGRYVEISVVDRGIGMTPNIRARAFDPFFTTKEFGKGTGLGLSQVFGFARQAGGTARIESSPGQGTKVSLLLPVANGDTAQPRQKADQKEVDAGRGTVLVIDDDQDVRMFLLESLDALGYHTLEASDGESGLALLAENAPDVIVVDYAMPGLNGAEVAQAARSRRPDLPVVFITGYADQAAMRAAAADAPILHKPFRVAELAATLRSCLDGNRPSMH